MDTSLSFPDVFTFRLDDSVDDGVRAFARNHRNVLTILRTSIVFAVNFIEDILLATPWWLFILIVVFLGYKSSQKWQNGIVYGVLVFLIGVFGLWNLMLETLSLMIFSVIVSIIIGFTLGIVVAMGERSNAVIRPVLDVAQTIPTFVYIIPAIMLLGVGRAPAVIATVCYAFVPMVRMTSHGIMNVDKDVIEASTAFGSTKFQTLVKVQLPQALPTIMVGVNQTIMMAMGMVVTCALIGATGLGMEILVATNRVEIERALLPGIAIVIMAVVLDRLTQGMIREEQDKEYRDEAEEEEVVVVAKKSPNNSKPNFSLTNNSLVLRYSDVKFMVQKLILGRWIS